MINDSFRSDQNNLDQITPLNKNEKIAVRNLSISFNSGEIFGLLGPNGAGKTTSIGMVTTEVVPDAGTVKISSKDLNVADLRTFYQNVGLCPQHNPLWDEITLREHLLFYASIKKIPEYSIIKKCDE